MLSSKNALYSICLTDIVKQEPKQLVLIRLTRRQEPDLVLVA
jgi:hypothetical protein